MDENAIIEIKLTRKNSEGVPISQVPSPVTLGELRDWILGTESSEEQAPEPEPTPE